MSHPAYCAKIETIFGERPIPTFSLLRIFVWSPVFPWREPVSIPQQGNPGECRDGSRLADIKAFIQRWKGNLFYIFCNMDRSYYYSETHHPQEYILTQCLFAIFSKNFPAQLFLCEISFCTKQVYLGSADPLIGPKSDQHNFRLGKVKHCGYKIHFPFSMPCRYSLPHIYLTEWSPIWKRYRISNHSKYWIPFWFLQKDNNPHISLVVSQICTVCTVWQTFTE